MATHITESTVQHSTPLRERLVDAAAKVYAEFGFRGATTRLIAETAGVNEVTLFRTFGSKAALIAEAVLQHAAVEVHAVLPEVPVDPLAEMTAWANGYMTHIRALRGMILKTMGEFGERPEMAPAICSGMEATHTMIASYVAALRTQGFATADFDTDAAVSMLEGALFGDSMGREMVPQIHPQPVEQAPEMYARLFLRALGVAVDTAAPVPSPSPASHS